MVSLSSGQSNTGHKKVWQQPGSLPGHAAHPAPHEEARHTELRED